MSLSANREAKEIKTKNAIPNAISDCVAGTWCLIQETKSTGEVFRVWETAVAAPVSLRLLVKTSIAPDRKLYFVSGTMIFLKT